RADVPETDSGSARRAGPGRASRAAARVVVHGAGHGASRLPPAPAPARPRVGADEPRPRARRQPAAARGLAGGPVFAARSARRKTADAPALDLPPRVVPPAAGGRLPRRGRGPRRPSRHADGRGQVALLSASRPRPGRHDARGLAAHRADGRPGGEAPGPRTPRGADSLGPRPRAVARGPPRLRRRTARLPVRGPPAAPR